MVYEILKALHIVAVISWMAGLLYLPRLFVYHAEAEKGSAQSETFKVMERRLLRGIMNPAMVAVWVFGLLLAWQGDWWHAGWWQVKFSLVVGLTFVHHLYSRWRKDFAADKNARPARYYRWWNEVPTILMIVIVFLAVLKPSFAQANDAGFVASRLDRIAPWYQTQVDSGAFPGAVVAIARDGQLAYLQAVGTQDRAKTQPMKPDSIFWIASMTKPVTSVAAMILVDEGKLELEAPVAKYLPEVADMRVGLEGAPQKRPMQVIDLLRHTSGFTYADEGADELHKAYDRIGSFRRDRTLAKLTGDLVRMRLVHQPGDVWEYSHGVDVLGRVVEIASGQPLDRFFEERIFKPLGMVDTGFFVPPDKLARLVDPIPGGRSRLWDVTKPTTLFMGGGGLVSTAPDYLRFAQMLLNGGELDGVRILKADTVRRMTTPTLPPDIRFAGVVGGLMGPTFGRSWGLGFAIRTNPGFSFVPGSVGSYTWNGIWGTYFWIDPAEKLVGVQMIQIAPAANFGQYWSGLRHLTYAALRAPEAAASSGVPAQALSACAGQYDFGASLSARDRQAPLPAFSGVGLMVDIRSGEAIVRLMSDDAPAAKAGVRTGDVVTAIDGRPVKGLDINTIIGSLRGPAGSEVRLRVARKDQDQPAEFVIVRQPVRVPGAQIEVRVVDGKLVVEAIGAWSVLDFEKGKPVTLAAVSDSEFQFQGAERTLVRFAGDRVVLNPGPWQIEGTRVQ